LKIMRRSRRRNDRALAGLQYRPAIRASFRAYRDLAGYLPVRHPGVLASPGTIP
jgi:hypothetical protein